MTTRRLPAVVLSAGLLLAPAPAFAAVGHASASHPAGGLAAMRHRAAAELNALRKRVAGVEHALDRASLSQHQRNLLDSRFAALDGLAGLQRAVRTADQRKDLQRVTVRAHRLSRLVDAQTGLIREFRQVGGCLRQWQALHRRLDADQRRRGVAEENPQVMADLDTAVTRLTDADRVLTGDVRALLRVAGEGSASSLAVVGRRSAGSRSHVMRELRAAAAALRDLESALDG